MDCFAETEDDRSETLDNEEETHAVLPRQTMSE
ncbi:hypothetical protein Dpo_1c05710 [Desulfotignum phosphitoxidans DSM 13687]|uniref:Uncharacterized protein n=1 Tax=Desulfotignum phosphitoxidans DSM 13687 TaxID=1286635 RepID=S0G3E4_9BACT|nr:hypothetical protein Dpo_1c05710 [Desulfotignum phosphitoxidans DSM 13687]